MFTFKNLLLAIIGLIILQRLYKIVHYLIYSGFAPFRSKNHWAIEPILADIAAKKLDPDKPVVVYSVNAGPAGFLWACHKLFPHAKLVAVQTKRRYYLLNRLQALFHFSKIEFQFRKNVYGLEIEDATVLYCRLGPEALLELTKKFKYELGSGVWLISSKTPVPNLPEKKIYNIPPVIKQRFGQKKKSEEELKRLATVNAEMHYLYEI